MVNRRASRRKKRIEGTIFAERCGSAAEVFTGVDDEGVKLVEEPVIGGEAAFEERAKVIVGMARGGQRMAFEDAARVGVNDEDRVAASV
jgi:hypothetical protein